MKLYNQLKLRFETPNLDKPEPKRKIANKFVV